MKQEYHETPAIPSMLLRVLVPLWANTSASLTTILYLHDNNISQMQHLLKAEELLMFAVSVYGMIWLDLPISWWLYPLLFFAPDIGMIGYVVNTRVGAVTYNLLHHKGIAIALFITGMGTGHLDVAFAGVILLGHASFDRIFGYGLKYADSFHHTHLGQLRTGR